MKTTRKNLSRERINSLGILELRAILIDKFGTLNGYWATTENVNDLRSIVTRICHG